MDAQPPRRGLGALLQRTTGGAPGTQATPATLNPTPIRCIRPNPNQPRKDFDETALEELAASIRAKGIIQPIVLRELPPAEVQGELRYEIIAGERRWRASQRAGLQEVPAYVKPVFSESEVLLLSLIENLQRDDLNPIEEGLAYQRLRDTYQLTQDQVAEAVGKSRVAVSNAVRLLELPEPIQDAIRSGKLSMGHAKILMSVPDRKLQLHLSAKTQAEGLTVRQLEIFAVGDEEAATTETVTEETTRGPARPPRTKPDHIRSIERKLSEHLGTRVKVEEGARKGKIVIEFYSVKDFDRLTKQMGLKDE
ncbi:MAG: ParB/RepB/Spo0J family partition protein [Planctomycetes bacterium]|nr:ParB/RepB/Spo0J family partition protein [Planctomycetota bacterium]